MNYYKTAIRYSLLLILLALLVFSPEFLTEMDHDAHQVYDRDVRLNRWWRFNPAQFHSALLEKANLVTLADPFATIANQRQIGTRFRLFGIRIMSLPARAAVDSSLSQWTILFCLILLSISTKPNILVGRHFIKRRRIFMRWT
jgi:hypothetical protein